MSEIQQYIPHTTGQESVNNVFDNIKKYLERDNLDEAKNLLFTLHPADLADFIDHTPEFITKKLLPEIIEGFDPETLIWLNPKSIALVNLLFEDTKLAEFINQLSVEDAIEVLDKFSHDTKHQLIELFPTAKKQLILEAFNYPDHTTGRVMEKNYVAFFEYWTIGQAIDSIKIASDIPENLHAAIIVDTRFRPVGNIMFSALLKFSRSTPIRDIMNSDLIVTDAHTALSDLSYIFKQYALSVVPVINKFGQLVGIVSIENMLYIIQEQAEETILHLGGVNDANISDNLVFTAIQRFPWLFINLITACLTSVIISSFGSAIAKIIALASIMPIVASIGGNAGTQTMTVTVRSIANKDVDKVTSNKIILKELLSCTFNGTILALIGGLIIIALFQDIKLGAIFSVAVVINFIIAGFFGSAIPLILHYMKMDPATASGVILSTITDSCGVLIFLGLAQHLLL